jgi:glutathione S-transferase
MTTRVWHLAVPSDWARLEPTGSYDMSTRGMTLAEVGFVHCSHRHQLEGVARRFYADLDELLLLEIDPARLTAPIVEEPPAPGIDELFPHAYGPIDIDAVVGVTRWVRDGSEWELDQAGPENTPA